MIFIICYKIKCINSSEVFLLNNHSVFPDMTKSARLGEKCATVLQAKYKTDPEKSNKEHKDLTSQ